MVMALLQLQALSGKPDAGVARIALMGRQLSCASMLRSRCEIICEAIARHAQRSNAVSIFRADLQWGLDGYGIVVIKFAASHTTTAHRRQGGITVGVK
jgi:hypothetical protein